MGFAVVESDAMELALEGKSPECDWTSWPNLLLCARTAFELELSCCFPATEAGNNNKIDAAQRHSAAWIGCNAAKSVWRDLVQLSLAVRFGSFFAFFVCFLLVLLLAPSVGRLALPSN